jgi:hypothetical protein
MCFRQGKMPKGTHHRTKSQNNMPIKKKPEPKKKPVKVEQPTERCFRCGEWKHERNDNCDAGK